MTNAEFQVKLKAAFEAHTLMKDRNQHTINELLYVLEHDESLNKGNYNVAIQTMDGRWWSIPCLDAFVNVKTRGVWFNDADIEFEVDECEGMKFDCVTVCECERSD